MRTSLRCVWLVGVAAAGCIEPAAFPCERDEQCDAGTRAGRCQQPEGYCAYEDSQCPSGFRFESRAPGALGGSCVEESAGTTGDDVCGGHLEECCDEECDGSLECLGQLCGCAFFVLAGDSHSCFIRLDGSIECWGANESGQLGRATSGSFDPMPGPVAGIPAPLALSSAGARGHSCLVDQTGRVFCWGNNQSRQVNPDLDLDVVDTATLVLDEQVFGWSARLVGVGALHTCAGGEGQVFCWGDNEVGQLGWEAEEPQVVDTSNWRGEIEQLAAGAGHTCAHTLEESGQHHVYCWGWGEFGQLGDGEADASSSVPTEVAFAPGTVVYHLSASDLHSCAVTATADAPEDRRVECWGDNQSGQSTADGTAGANLPTPVAGLADGPWISVAAGSTSTCAVSDDNGVWCWGDNTFGKVVPGLPSGPLPPTRVPLLDLGTEAITVSVGTVHTCATAADATVRCWGCGSMGQLGPDTSLFCDGEGGDYGTVTPSCP